MKMPPNPHFHAQRSSSFSDFQSPRPSLKSPQINFNATPVILSLSPSPKILCGENSLVDSLRLRASAVNLLLFWPPASTIQSHDKSAIFPSLYARYKAESTRSINS
ncbi:hypothetical protein IAD21_03158 [Abditibacteriota bacterium]|nr:hypothetical protein IAD21_03158 [Abditibacteriota bacterium]